MLNLKNILTENNLKVTPQRINILKIIEETGHITIEELFEIVKENLPYISLATVYKNISTLKEKGILKEIGINNKKLLYEIKNREHGHFICIECGEIWDFDFPSKLDLPESFKIIKRKDLFIYGICRECAN